MMRKVKYSMAPGVDQVTREMLREGVKVSCKYFHAVYMKAMNRGKVPKDRMDAMTVLI